MKNHLKTFCILLGFSNAFFLAEWVNLIGEGVNTRVLLNPTPMTGPYLALSSLILGLAFLGTVLNFLIVRSRKSAIEQGFWTLVGCSILVPLNYMRVMLDVVSGRQLVPWINFVSDKYLLLFLVGLAPVIIFSFDRFRGKYSSDLFKSLGLVLFPFSIICLLNLCQIYFKFGYVSPVSEQLKTISKNKPTKKTIWLIFDEFDQRVAFESKAMKNKLPELNRLKHYSLSFKKAYSPQDFTINSLPSLISGEKVRTKYTGHDLEIAATYIDNFDLELTTSDKLRNVKWSQLSNVFTEASNLGYHVGVLGWYHGYCQLFGSSVDYCRRFSFSRMGYPESYQASVVRFLKGSLHSRQTSSIEASASNSLELMKSLNNIIEGNQIDFVFAHFPFPHYPAIYDPNKKIVSANVPQTADGYLANLELVDATIGNIRKILEKNGSWNDTTLIVSSDHQWRCSEIFDGQSSKSVPYLIKMPDSKAAEVDFPVATIHTKDFILSILKNQIKTSSEAVAWIKDRNKNFPIGSLMIPFEEERKYYQKIQASQPLNPRNLSTILENTQPMVFKQATQEPKTHQSVN